MKAKILKCISTIDELNVEELNKNRLGVEIQDFVEPNLSKDEKESLIEEYRRRLIDLNGEISIHGPFLDLKPSSPDEDIKKVSREKYIEALQIANRLGASFIVFHSQINPYLKEPFLRELNNLQAKEFWEEALLLTEFKGIILLENIFEETPLMLKELVECINNNRIRINLDLGHLNLSKTPLNEWFEELKDYIDYIHIHGNNGVYDEHNTPSDDLIVDLHGAIRRLKKYPTLALEYKTEDISQEIERYNSLL